MATVNSSLSTRQEKVLALLISEPSVKEAAKTAGIGERTLHRWLKNEAFAAAYRDARTNAVRQAMGQIQAAMGTAVRTLVQIMQDSEVPSSSRVQSAKAVIENAIKLFELEEIEQRLSIIEIKINKGR